MAKKPYLHSYTNGEYDVEFKSELIPTGTITLTQNGNYSVGPYESAVVNVEGGGITPTGTKNITENGLVDVTTYAKANVNVPQGVFPTGTKEITENGTYDITSFASALVNVEGGGGGIMTKGTFTPLTESEPILIEHGIGNIPDYIYVVTSSDSAGATATFKGCYKFTQPTVGNLNLDIVTFQSQYNSWRAGVKGADSFSDIDEDFAEITPAGSLAFQTGATYYWVAIKI